MEVRSRDGSKVLEPEGLEAFDDRRITKLISTGGVGAHCYQLCTEGGGAAWKQVSIPENSLQSILVIPVRTQEEVIQGGQGTGMNELRMA